MSNKYQTGGYRVIGFDRYGTKVRDQPAKPDSFQGALDTGRGMVNADKAVHSFVVHRVLYNSKDHEV